VAAAGAPGRFVRDTRQRHLALATLTALLLGTTGGLSGVFAYTVTAQVRTWTRLSIFIAFFALAAIGLLLDASLEHLRGRGVRTPRVAVAALLLVVCGVGVLDQTTPSNVPAYAANAAAYRSDQEFADAIEQRIGDGGTVLQLPYVPFPENKPVGGTGPYDHVRPYLHSRTLSWSFGAMRGRPADWQADTAGAPPEQLVPAIAAAGFDGIYVDRFAYPDFAAGLEPELQQVAGSTPLVSADDRFSFFDLRAYARRLRAETPPAELQALADATVRPVRTEWSDGFAPRQQDGVDSSRWAQVPDPSLTVVNPSDQPRSTELFVKLTRAGGESVVVTITYPGGITQRVDVPPEGIDVERTLQVPSGNSTIRFAIEGGAITAPNGAPAAGYLQLRGWRLTPTVP
jgi:phosphoglycerol transferase